MIFINSINLIGRLTKDPELRFASGNGTAVCKFTLAVNRAFKKGEVDFINCVSFGKTAETISQYITKGRMLGVNGSLQIGSYDGQDGIKRYTADVLVSGFTFVDSNNSNSSSNNNNNNSQSYNDSNFEVDITPVDDGEMPF